MYASTNCHTWAVGRSGAYSAILMCTYMYRCISVRSSRGIPPLYTLYSYYVEIHVRYMPKAHNMYLFSDSVKLWLQAKLPEHGLRSRLKRQLSNFFTKIWTKGFFLHQTSKYSQGGRTLSHDPPPPPPPWKNSWHRPYAVQAVLRNLCLHRPKKMGHDLIVSQRHPYPNSHC